MTEILATDIGQEAAFLWLVTHNSLCQHICFYGHVVSRPDLNSQSNLTQSTANATDDWYYTNLKLLQEQPARKRKAVGTPLN